jgi:hypothetical protein
MLGKLATSVSHRRRKHAAWAFVSGNGSVGRNLSVLPRTHGQKTESATRVPVPSSRKWESLRQVPSGCRIAEHLVVILICWIHLDRLLVHAIAGSPSNPLKETVVALVLASPPSPVRVGMQGLSSVAYKLAVWEAHGGFLPQKIGLQHLIRRLLDVIPSVSPASSQLS